MLLALKMKGDQPQAKEREKPLETERKRFSPTASGKERSPAGTLILAW